jgi:hypothetical protein
MPFLKDLLQPSFQISNLNWQRFPVYRAEHHLPLSLATPSERCWQVITYSIIE